MGLTERSRSALYQGLSSIVDEAAVEEMLSYFPARDIDEPVTTNHLRVEMSGLRTELHVEMAGLRTELRDEIAELRTEVKGEIAELRTEVKGEIAELRTEVATELNDKITGLRSDLKADMTELELRMNDRLDDKFRSMFALTIGANVATVVTIAMVIFAAIRL